MINVTDTIYSSGDVIIARLKECDDVMPILIEHTTKINNGNKDIVNCLFSPSFTICCTVIIIALIAAISLLKYYKIEKKEQKNKEDKMNEAKGDKSSSDEKERLEWLLSLKQEYQKSALKYLEEKKGVCDVEKDAFMVTINDYLSKIENSINGQGQSETKDNKQK